MNISKRFFFKFQWMKDTGRKSYLKHLTTSIWFFFIYNFIYPYITHLWIELFLKFRCKCTLNVFSLIEWFLNWVPIESHFHISFNTNKSVLQGEMYFKLIIISFAIKCYGERNLLWFDKVLLIQKSCVLCLGKAQKGNLWFIL